MNETLVIPSTFDSKNGTKYKVTAIGEGAFEDCYELKYVKIPNGVAEIEPEAFYKVPHIYYSGLAEQCGSNSGWVHGN